MLKSLRRMKKHFSGDVRILEDSGFVEQVLESEDESMEERYRLAAEGYTFERTLKQLSNHFRMYIDSILFPGEHPDWVKSCSVAADFAVRRLDLVGTTLAE